MMKSTILIGFLLGTVCVVIGEKAAAKVSNIKIDAILHNNIVLSNYLNCLLEKGPCKGEVERFKTLLPDAIQTDCSQCTADQKRNSKKIINFLRTRRPADWKSLKAKYDPESKYLSKLTGD